MKRPYFKFILGAVFWLSATIILAALMISAATVSTTLTSFPTDSTPFLEALWGTPYANESTQGHLGALVFWAPWSFGSLSSPSTSPPSAFSSPPPVTAKRINGHTGTTITHTANAVKLLA